MTTISICSSIKFADKITLYKDKLEAMGYKCLYPVLSEKVLETLEETVEDKIKNNYIKKHYDKVKMSDGVLILNFDKNGIQNFIGGNTFMELGFAYTMNKDIFIINPVPEDMAYSSEIKSTQPIIINNDLNLIDEYYSGLDKAYVTSESELKLRSVSKSFRDLNLKFNISGFKSESGVSEQPSSIAETVAGSNNRLDNLKTKVTKDYQYLVSVESGIVKFNEFENYIGCVACTIENKEGKRETSFTTDMFFPKEFTDLVPSKYADLGVLVQDKFGAKEKDPYVFMSNGKINRPDTLEFAIKAAISKFN